MTMSEVKSLPVLSEGQCAEIANTVRKIEHLWVSRRGGLFYTVGASTYNDLPEDYPQMAYLTNMELTRYFGGVIQFIADLFEEERQQKVVFLPGCGLMGFHVFKDNCNGVEGHIHVDEPYKRIAWPLPVVDAFTFTLPVELPSEAGINFYPTIDEAWFSKYDAGEDIPPPEAPKYLKYEVGTLYVHSGHTPHQIANPCDMEPHEARITLQGHGVVLEDNTVVLYF